jgi:hypothetical protein
MNVVSTLINPNAIHAHKIVELVFMRISSKSIIDYIPAQLDPPFPPLELSL